MDHLASLFSDHVWAAWVIAALVLAGAELVSLDLVLLMLAVGALAGGVVAVLGAPISLDVITAVVVSIAMLGAVRPSVVRRLHAGPTLTTGHAALVGRSAQVLNTVNGDGGRVRLAGEEWSARAYDPSLTIEPGCRVTVFEIDGATALVHPE